MSGWSWTLLNLYLTISLCAICFDLFVMLTSTPRRRAQERLQEELRSILEAQTARARDGLEPDPRLQQKLSRLLRRIDGVLAFSDLADAYSAAGDGGFAAWLSQSGPLFAKLCRSYARRQRMYRASFAWMLAACRQDIPAAEGFLRACAADPRSIYCRENALTALYRGGNGGAVLAVLKRMGREDIRHSQKLLVDGLLSFQGDREALCGRLWAEFGSLSPSLRLVTVDFTRLLGADRREALLDLLDREDTDDELCFAILRYFSRCTYPPALSRMISFLSSPRRGLWEYAAVSASVLRAYPAEEAANALRGALAHPNWYVRYNAADSLVSMDLPEWFFTPVLEGPDPYARDILRYMLDRRELAARKGGVGLVHA